MEGINPMRTSIFFCIALFLLAHCGYEGPYPRLSDGPSVDKKPSITLEEAKAEVALMKKDRDALSQKP